MSLNAELAAAARWIRARAERLPESERPDVARLWRELLTEVENCWSDGAAELAVIQWRQDLEAKLGPTTSPAAPLAESARAGLVPATSDTRTGAGSSGPGRTRSPAPDFIRSRAQP
jgi:hypothetical protein